MKKFWLILVILAVAVLVSACSSAPAASPSSDNAAVTPLTNPGDNSAPADNSGGLGSPVVPSSEINTATSSGDQAASNAPTATSSAASSTNSINSTTMPSPDQQENLLKTYSAAILHTNFGDITLKFYPTDAPITVNNFLNLAKAGFYNGTKFHRIIKGFMIQGGDPLTKGSDISLYGTGGPGYQFQDEYNNHVLAAGTLAMANAGPNTNGSQFFIVTSPTQLNLQGHYTIFGQVSAGLDTVTKIENVPVGPNPSNPAEMSFPSQDVIVNSVELVK